MGIQEDGFSTTISFSAGGSGIEVFMAEKTVTPPGISGGGGNDVTTMRNTEWRTMAAKKLKTLTNGSATVAYDPAIYDEILALVQVNQLITITFPDTSTVDFWGFLDEFTPGDSEEGEQPTADLVIIPSNRNNDGTEVGPDYTEPIG